MKGVAFTWIMVFVTLAVVGIIYIPLSQILEAHYFPAMQEMAGSNENINNVINVFEKSWYWGIVVFIIGLFVWAILRAQKRVPETGYYEGW